MVRRVERKLMKEETKVIIELFIVVAWFIGMAIFTIFYGYPI